MKHLQRLVEGSLAEIHGHAVRPFPHGTTGQNSPTAFQTEGAVSSANQARNSIRRWAVAAAREAEAAMLGSSFASLLEEFKQEERKRLEAEYPPARLELGP